MKIVKIAGPAAIVVGALMLLLNDSPMIGGLVMMIGSLAAIALSINKN